MDDGKAGSGRLRGTDDWEAASTCLIGGNYDLSQRDIECIAAYELLVMFEEQ